MLLVVIAQSHADADRNQGEAGQTGGHHQGFAQTGPFAFQGKHPLSQVEGLLLAGIRCPQRQSHSRQKRRGDGLTVDVDGEQFHVVPQQSEGGHQFRRGQRPHQLQGHAIRLLRPGQHRGLPMNGLGLVGHRHRPPKGHLQIIEHLSGADQGQADFLFHGADQNTVRQEVFETGDVGIRRQVQDVQGNAHGVERGEGFRKQCCFDRGGDCGGPITLSNRRLHGRTIVVQGDRQLTRQFKREGSRNFPLVAERKGQPAHQGGTAGQTSGQPVTELKIAVHEVPQPSHLARHLFVKNFHNQDERNGSLVAAEDGQTQNFPVNIDAYQSFCHSSQCTFRNKSRLPCLFTSA